MFVAEGSAPVRRFCNTIAHVEHSCVNEVASEAFHPRTKAAKRRMIGCSGPDYAHLRKIQKERAAVVVIATLMSKCARASLIFSKWPQTISQASATISSIVINVRPAMRSIEMRRFLAGRQASD